MEVKYVTGNLTISPCFQPGAIQLASYIAGQAWSINYIKNVTEKQAERVALSNYNIIDVEADRASTTPAQSTVTANSPNSQQRLYSAVLSPSSESSTGSATYSKQNQSDIPPKRQGKRSKPWTYGKDLSKTDNQTPQLRHLCLGIRSGPDETTDSLKKIIEQWSDLRNVQIDAVSKTNRSTMFRVQFVSPAYLIKKWTEATIWPARIAVRPWVGNPKAPLKTLEERVYRKKIYVGNLRPNIEMKQVQTNMEKVYQMEMSEGPIAQVEAFLNENAWNSQKKQQLNNHAHVLRKSACVVLTSKPGRDLNDIDLKLDSFSVERRRAIRVWNGPIPWPQNHEKMRAPSALQLTW